MTVERSDEVFGTRPIMDDIWEGITSAELVLADVTGRNPNVMYEVGIAHTYGTPVCLVTQDVNDIPFDLRHFRFIVYSYTPRGCAELEKSLIGTVSALRGR